MPQAELNTVLISLVGVVVAAILAFLAKWYWDSKAAMATLAAKRDAERESAAVRIADLELKLAVLTANMAPVTTAFQAMLVKGLTHMHYPVTDKLLGKIGPPYTLSPAEEAELLEALTGVASNTSPLFSQIEADAARMLPMVIRRAKAETMLGIHDPILTLTPSSIASETHQARVETAIEKLSRQTTEHDQWERARVAALERGEQPPPEPLSSPSEQQK